jgi:hypothetical protein
VSAARPPQDRTAALQITERSVSGVTVAAMKGHLDAATAAGAGPAASYRMDVFV